jgi:hypothetical protein
MVPTNIGYIYWLSFTKPTLKVASADRSFSLVAHTRKHGHANLCIELAQAYHNLIADFTETSQGSAGRLNEARELWEPHGYSKRTPREHTGDASLPRSRRSWLWRREGGSTGQAWADDSAPGDVVAEDLSQDGGHEEK